MLSRFLPICTSCKQIRDDRGYWKQIKTSIRDNSEVEFSHSICPECAKKLYLNYLKKNNRFRKFRNLPKTTLPLDI
ncbi:MAG: hypothetical protein KKB30_03955 [Proteobacteria bacterium]|nr:hypothetical protein [Pseudomonadota bacterium]MBU1717008.1 hypothetical protein [Pseudomonadota bacterium]